MVTRSGAPGMTQGGDEQMKCPSCGVPAQFSAGVDQVGWFDHTPTCPSNPVGTRALRGENAALKQELAKRGRAAVPMKAVPPKAPEKLAQRLTCAPWCTLLHEHIR